VASLPQLAGADTSQTDREIEAVKAVLTQTPVPADLFSSTFLAQVPAAQLTPTRNSLTAPIGTFVRVSGSNGQYVATYTRGTMNVSIHLDSAGKIDAMFLHQPVVTGGTLDEALSPLRSLSGSVSYIVLDGAKDVASYNADKELSVGSTFKLAALNALRSEIADGKRHWNDVVTLSPAWKSLPSGVLQSWPDGSYLTLQTIATEMISISDNTAADAVVHLVGRDIDRFAGNNTPFLTTREMFLLKLRGNDALRERYRNGTATTRASVLKSLDRMPLPSVQQLDMNPAYADIEWHYTNRQLCRMMDGVRDLPFMTVNPGVASPSQWKRIAYKGGSDGGVISMTTALESRSGKRYCVSATWNDTHAEVDESRFAALYGAAIGALAGGR
jgi:beta-lactamase class A